MDIGKSKDFTNYFTNFVKSVNKLLKAAYKRKEDKDVAEES